MNFETPAALWALLSLLLLFIFSLWRQAAERVTVPSLLLWKKIPERNPPIRALRRPRWRFEMLLQALAIAAIVAALAGPYAETSEFKPRTVAFVFDTSARLRAEGRLEKLKADAKKLMEGDLKNDRVLLFAAVPSPRRLGGLDEVVQLDCRVDLAPLLAAAKQSAEHVVLFSDRPGEGVHSLSYGRTTVNRGIAELLATDSELFVRVAPEAAVEIEAQPGGTATTKDSVWSTRADFSRTAAVRVALKGADSLGIDDVVEGVRLGDPRLTASLSGQDISALADALKAIGGVTVTRTDRPTKLSIGVDDAPGAGEVRVRIHRAQASSAPVEVLPHALTADLKSRTQELAALAPLPAGEGAGEKLILVGGKPAVVLRGKELHVAVDLAQWQKTPSFPIFWTNVVDFARKGSGAFAVIRAGQPFALPEGTTVESAPAGAIWSVSPGGEFLACTAGEFGLKTRDRSVTVRVHLLDELESSEAGVTRPLDWNPGAPAGREVKRRELAGFFAGAAALLILLGWVLQRRGE